ncbi:DUF4318 domain-containing protein [Clostridium beijerinckii]|uniref:DUF4318 domain-containing protein n=1 Tax=Clostridium beijerinckii TaxID=1520 RepID=A0A7X9XR55_CLOBE|nr:DUF4318 domain-containing protein [Clostridium beijerinckii]NMF07189.1 DUF4318 domain-containing protein [Clostridium beijerinckii]
MFNLSKKSFLVDLDDSLTYPSAQTICNAIEKYCISSKEKCQFVSTQNPVTFYLEDKLFSAEITMARGGYMIKCLEK